MLIKGEFLLRITYAYNFSINISRVCIYISMYMCVCVCVCVSEIKTLVERLVYIVYNRQDGKPWASENGRTQASEPGSELL